MEIQFAGYAGQGLQPFVSRQNAVGTGALFNLGSTTSLSAQDAQALSQTFAQSIVSRLAEPENASLQSTEATSGATLADQTSATTADTQALEQALASTVDYVRGKFGDKAATAVMAMVYKQAGDQPITEQSLGQGLLNGLKLIDRQFGFAAGDAYMAHLNSNLNKEVNAYFDNGLMERFMAADSGQAQTHQTLSLVVEKARDTLGEQAATSLLDIISQGLDQEDGIPPETLAEALQKAEEFIQGQREELGVLANDLESLLANGLAASNASNSPYAQPAGSVLGSALDLTV